MNFVIEGLKYVYRCCGLIVSEKESQIFAMDYCLIYNSIRSRLLVISNIANCGISENCIRHCFTYRKLFLLGN